MTRTIKMAATIMLAALAVSGCTVSEVITAEKTELDVASLDIAESMLLDVGIRNFDPGVPKNNDPEDTGIYPEVRDAEARYLPYHAKTTLQGTGFWGAVRVVPDPYEFSDVMVYGRILRSDGEFVELMLGATDSLGNHWFEKEYSMQTGLTSYAEYRDRRDDPYQKIFNDFANDLRAYASQLDGKQVTRLQEASELKFFADMAPTAYGDYLTIDEDGMTTINRLPATNDPMVTRLRQIRERDRLVIDTLNEHYANFYYGIALPYEGWRKTAREQAVAYRQARRSATMRALLGVAVMAGSMSIDTSGSHSRTKTAAKMVGINRGWNTIIDAWRMRSMANVHREEIKELSESFVSEAAPMVIQVEGESRRLTGTAESQYEGWRKIIRELYEIETGFSESIDVSAPARSNEPAG